MQFIDLKKQYQLIEKQINDRIQTVLQHGKFIMGPEIAELEAELAKFAGVKHAISVSSGTDALLISMLALGIKAGDEVITTPFSFIATAETIALIGAKPVFVDIEPDTYNINTALIESAITDKTKAIMPVSLYGQCADLTEINKVAKQYNLPVIEDAAQSFGAKHHGAMSCGMTTIGCTSFFPAKPLGCYGDGGACFTDDDEIANIMRQVRVHGSEKRYHHAVVGINGRMDTLQAAILIEKLKIFPKELELRQAVAARYSKALAGTVHIPYLKSGNTSAFAQYTIEVPNRAQLQEKLKAENIPTAVHYPMPLHLQKAFAYLGYEVGTFPVAELAAKQVMSLPMHPYLEETDQATIVAHIEAFNALQKSGVTAQAAKSQSESIT